MQDSARARVSPRSRSRSTTTRGRSRPSSLNTRPPSASRRSTASSSIRASASGGESPCATRCSSTWPDRPEDRGLRVLEPGVDGGGDLVHLALGHGGDAQDAPDHDARGAGPRAQPREHLLVEHRLHLPGRAGQQDEQPAPGLEGLARCGAPRVGQRLGPLDHVGLLRVGGRHRPPVAGEPRAQGLHDRVLAPERAPRGRGGGLPREVVGGRPEPAGGDHHVGAGERLAERGLEEREVVGQRGARRDLDPGVEEPLGEPERVRLGAQRPEQLAADRQELRLHAPATGQTRRPTRRARCA